MFAKTNKKKRKGKQAGKEQTFLLKQFDQTFSSTAE